MAAAGRSSSEVETPRGMRPTGDRDPILFTPTYEYIATRKQNTQVRRERPVTGT